MTVVQFPNAKPSVLILAVSGLEDRQEVAAVDETRSPWCAIAALVRVAWAAGIAAEAIEEILRIAIRGRFADVTLDIDTVGLVVGLYLDVDPW